MRRRKGETLDSYRERKRVAQQDFRTAHPTYERDRQRAHRQALREIGACILCSCLVRGTCATYIPDDVIAAHVESALASVAKSSSAVRGERSSVPHGTTLEEVRS
jgi:hypothetical protein